MLDFESGTRGAGSRPAYKVVSHNAKGAATAGPKMPSRRRARPCRVGACRPAWSVWPRVWLTKWPSVPLTLRYHTRRRASPTLEKAKRSGSSSKRYPVCVLFKISPILRPSKRIAFLLARMSCTRVHSSATPFQSPTKSCTHARRWLGSRLGALTRLVASSSSLRRRPVRVSSATRRFSSRWVSCRWSSSYTLASFSLRSVLSARRRRRCLCTSTRFA
jgi:hypothetical protein